MIATLLLNANTNLIKLQKQMMPFLKLLVENAIDISDCASWQLMGKLMHRSEIFILETRKLLAEFGKLRKHNLEIKRKMIESGEFIEIDALLHNEEWFINIEQALNNYYTDYKELDKLIIQYPGIYYLVTCFQNQEEGGAKNMYCYTNILEILWAWIILIMGSIIVYRRYMKHKDLSHYNRKQIIVTIMVVNICGSASNYIAYLLYQWSYESPIVYFPEYYFQYIFYCFTIYYFGRKSILLGMLNMRMDVAYQDIDPIIQLKLSKLFCIGLCSFFTIIFIMNYIQYFFTRSTYDLCSANFFNIVTTVGFFMQGLFILQVKQLSRQVQKNLSVQKLDQPMQKLKQQIEKNQSSLWVLVIFCFFGSFVNFVQNVYFVAQLAKVNTFQCTYVNLENKLWTNGINATIGTTIKFFDFFLPYFLTVKIFWYKKIEKIETESQNTEQNEVEVYELQLPNSQQTSQHEELQQ